MNQENFQSKRQIKIFLVAVIFVCFSLLGVAIYYFGFFKRNQICTQAVTKAKNTFTGRCREFSSPCALPFWYKIDKSCDSAESGSKTLQFFKKKITGRKVLKNQNGFKFEYDDSVSVFPSSSMQTKKDLPYASSIRIKSGKTNDILDLSLLTMNIQVLDFDKNENKITVLKDDCSGYKGVIEFQSLNELANIVFKETYNPNCNKKVKLIENLNQNFFKGKKSYEFTVLDSAITTYDGGFVDLEGNKRYIIFEHRNKFFLLSFDKDEKAFVNIIKSFNLID